MRLLGMIALQLLILYSSDLRENVCKERARQKRVQEVLLLLTLDKTRHTSW